MFVELKGTRGMEMFNVLGILRVAPSSLGLHSRLHLFSVPQPVELDQPYDEVKAEVAKVIGDVMAAFPEEGK